MSRVSHRSRDSRTECSWARPSCPHCPAPMVAVKSPEHRVPSAIRGLREPPHDLRLGLHAHDAIDLLASLEDQERRDAPKIEARGRGRVLVDIELYHAHAP